MRIPAWERENFRLNKGNIFPPRKILVSDIPSGEGKTAKPFFTVYELLSPSGARTSSKYNKADRLLRAGCSVVQCTAELSLRRMASTEYKLCK